MSGAPALFGGSRDPRRRSLTRKIITWIGVLAFLFGPGGPSLVFAAATTRQAQDAPVPISFPRDDGPHDEPIEWWYYTGHLTTSTGEHYGFELVFFRGEVAGIRGLAAHFAVTDRSRAVFRYDQRIAFDRGQPGDGDAGFSLAIDDWRMSGADGNDRLVASMADYAIALDLESMKPPALHDGDGYIDYGGRESTYYYSRTRLSVSGSLTVGHQVQAVTGEAWMDHQWGDFATFRERGWDWFSIQLDNQTELMLYVVHGNSDGASIVDGSLIAPDGTLTVLTQGDFEIQATGSWTSPTTGLTYPSGWTIEVPVASLTLTLTPTLLNQELDTRQTTGVIYWEGEVLVEGNAARSPVSGVGYVELTAYMTNLDAATPFTD